MFWHLILACLLIGILACNKPSESFGKFDPKDETQVLDVYVRSNYFKDEKVFETYGLAGKAGLAYTNAIVRASGDTVRWQRFLEKAEKHRQELEKSYPSQTSQQPTPQSSP